MNFENKTVCITGVCGTIGRQILKTLQLKGTKKIIGLDNQESAIFDLTIENQLEGISFYYCDIRNKNELISRTSNVDVLIHCAAMKHVMLSEVSPNETVLTNIIGVQNIISAAVQNRVAITLFTSSDKAVNPTNVMGTSKLMGERLISAAASNFADEGLMFGSTRFGNVLGSSGSVLPIFIKQAKEGKVITLTHDQMTRFVMSKENAANLVLDSLNLISCGEVIVTKMNSVFIKDLAELVIRKFGNSNLIKIIGAKPGEKLYEELVSDEECGRSFDKGDFITVVPATRKEQYSDSIRTGLGDNYNSKISEKMSSEDLLSYLEKNNLFET